MSKPSVEVKKIITSSPTVVATAYLTFKTEKRVQLIRITETINELVKESGVKEGICFVSPMHITSSVFVNDDERGLHSDFLVWLEKLAPHDPELYRHNLTGEDNADAHLKRTIMGRETVLAVTDGKLDLGPWEEIFYGEFDGMRPKKAVVKIIGIGEK